jgi:hypothetical protein
MNKKALFSILLVSFVLPIITYAQLWQPGEEIGYWEILNDFLNNFWVLMTAIAVICFAVSGILFLTAQGKPEQLTKAKSAVLWGVVGAIIAILAGSSLSIINSLITPAL